VLWTDLWENCGLPVGIGLVPVEELWKNRVAAAENLRKTRCSALENPWECCGDGVEKASLDVEIVLKKVDILRKKRLLAVERLRKSAGPLWTTCGCLTPGARP
jgi:hypothetical protein